VRRAPPAILIAAFALFATLAAIAQGAALKPVAYRTTERSDFSVYRNGAYLGHAYRETRGSIAPLGPDPSEPRAFAFEGSFYVLEETLRDLRSAAKSVDRAASSRFSLAPGGAMRFAEDGGFPSLRGLPALPEGELEPGSSWTAPGERCVELEGADGPIHIPFLAEYRLIGKADYRGRPALKLGAKFATRYRGSGSADPLAAATGTHELEITIDAESLAPLFIRDRFDETFTLARGGTERRAGFNLIFYDGAAPLDRAAAVAALQGSPRGATAPSASAALVEEAAPPGAGPGPLVAGEGEELDESTPAALGGEASGALGAAGVDLAESDAGVVLRVRDLRFVADSDQILRTELWRLDAIATALAAVPGRRILVEGHSAAVGKAAGELELSKRRAARVAAELVGRGIDPSLVMYRGLGSSRPIAPNDTEEGRARNRRVEITILDY